MPLHLHVVTAVTERCHCSMKCLQLGRTPFAAELLVKISDEQWQVKYVGGNCAPAVLFCHIYLGC